MNARRKIPDGQCDTSSRSSASSSDCLIFVCSAIVPRLICCCSRRWRRRAPKLSGMRHCCSQDARVATCAVQFKMHNRVVAGRECYHCKQWIEEGEPHDCWTTTEAALTADLSEDLRDAWERLRETAAEFGEQRIYASHKSIMFSRQSCYFFVRPKRNFLEVCVFLGRAIKAPQVRRADRTSRPKLANILPIR